MPGSRSPTASQARKAAKYTKRSGLIHVVAPMSRSVFSVESSIRVSGTMTADKMGERESLQEQLVRALEHADASGDFLIAALLSQCLALIKEREAATH